MENGSKRNDEVGIDRNKYFSSTIENQNLDAFHEWGDFLNSHGKHHENFRGVKVP